jgi:hypothetical protein
MRLDKCFTTKMYNLSCELLTTKHYKNEKTKKRRF